MSGGPIYPFSRIPQANGNVFPIIYQGAGGNNSIYEEGMGVVASLGVDSAWYLRYALPLVLPSGTAKIQLIAQANATSGNAKITIQDADVALGANPSSATLTSETQATITWAAGDNDKYKSALITLTPTLVAGDILVMAVVFNTSSWTLAANSSWQAPLIWQ